MGKVRIYELAKELKLENRKVLEDARRLGVDVSVPSNTLDDNIADKIRETYYPKKDAPSAHRTARLVKTVKTGPLPARMQPVLRRLRCPKKSRQLLPRRSRQCPLRPRSSNRAHASSSLSLNPQLRLP